MGISQNILQKNNKHINTYVSQATSWSLIAASSVAAFTAMFFANSKFYSESLNDAQKIQEIVMPERNRVWIELDFSNGSKRLFEGDLREGSYPLTAALQTAAEAGNFSYKIEKGRIISLAKRNGNWEIYHNDNLTKNAIEKITINKGDTYSFRLR